MEVRQLLINLGDLFFHQTLEKELHNMQSVLDVGCGSSSPLYNLKKNFYSVGIDIFKPSIKESRRKKIHDKYVLGDVLTLDSLFKKNSFDAVVGLDIIEHLNKKEGLTLLRKMELVSKKKVIIFTPNGFIEQHPYEENPFQKHKSGWTKKEFQKLGYTVYGMRGLRWIRGECATIKYKPWIFWGFISAVTQPFVYYFPQIAYQLLAVKEIHAVD